MQGLIDSGKYKVTEVLSSHRGFEAALCSDVTVSDGTVFIVNEYSSMAYIRELLPLFYEMEKKRFRGSRGLITANGSFSAVFVYRSGTPFAEYFPAHSREYDLNLKLADSLLRSALEFDLADDRIAACGLTAENAVVDEADRQVYFNLLLDPNRAAGENFRTKRLGEMLGQMFRRDRYFPDEISEYIEKLRAGGFPTCTAAYSAWREIQPAAQKTREDYQKESLAKYLGRRLRRSAKRRRRNGA